ncbi:MULTISPECIES: ArsC/Spx/MgsR family protein [unclassified Enterococcus]|uniref:ArsC/Spx/MgsR family protein n=1 Tax=unclassified Enterococcus TaxID=2608891 RepID=UPI0013EDC4A3|nr:MULTISPECIES: ArsC/Spx/MgsR family protein [unclassified Enterococcus]
MNRSELEKILLMSSHGFDNILSFRLKYYNRIKQKFDTISYEEALNLIIENSDLLRSPIIIDLEKGKKMVGFNKEEISSSLPRYHKRIIWKKNQNLYYN